MCDFLYKNKYVLYIPLTRFWYNAKMVKMYSLSKKRKKKGLSGDFNTT